MLQKSSLLYNKGLTVSILNELSAKKNSKFKRILS